MCIGGLDIESFDEPLYYMCKAACHLHINNVNLKYFEARRRIRRLL